MEDRRYSSVLHLWWKVQCEVIALRMIRQIAAKLACFSCHEGRAFRSGAVFPPARDDDHASLVLFHRQPQRLAEEHHFYLLVARAAYRLGVVR